MSKTMLIIITAVSLAIVTILVASKNKPKEMTLKQKILKSFYPVLMRVGKKEKINAPVVNTPVDFYSNKVVLNNESVLDLSIYKGKKIIIVNTASNCGYTGQYASLEKLYKQSG